MSEATWRTGTNPAAMLEILGAIGERKRRLASVALLRRLGYLEVSAICRHVIDHFDSEENPFAAELTDCIYREQRVVDSRNFSEMHLRDYPERYRGFGVTWPAEIPNAKADELDEYGEFLANQSARRSLRAFQITFESGSIDAVADQVREANSEATQAGIAFAMAKRWRQYADELAERTANQPRKRKVLISSAVDYVEREEESNNNKQARRIAEIESVERAAFVGVLRDIFGNPFRPITLDPRWLTSNVVDLSQAIYQERAFEKMPILADALMDAGCDDEEIIAHCRGPGPHVRGCWVVDLLLAKE